MTTSATYTHVLRRGVVASDLASRVIGLKSEFESHRRAAAVTHVCVSNTSLIVPDAKDLRYLLDTLCMSMRRIVHVLYYLFALGKSIVGAAHREAQHKMLRINIHRC